MDTHATFTLYLKIDDAEALHNAARAAALNDGFDEAFLATLRGEDGAVNLAACIRVLADPGISFPGTEIQDSDCETY